MKHGLFYDSFSLKLDEKNRLTIPADVRQSIVAERDGSSFFFVVGSNQKIWMYTELVFMEMAEQPLNQLPDDHDVEFKQLMYGMTVRRGWDAAHRVLMPEKLLKRTETGKDIALVGCHDHLEIWNQREWDLREEELERKRREIVVRAQLTKQPPKTV